MEQQELPARSTPELLNNPEDIQKSSVFKSACKNLAGKVVDFLSVQDAMEQLHPKDRRRIGIGMADAAIDAISPGNKFY